MRACVIGASAVLRDRRARRDRPRRSALSPREAHRQRHRRGTPGSQTWLRTPRSTKPCTPCSTMPWRDRPRRELRLRLRARDDLPAEVTAMNRLRVAIDGYMIITSWGDERRVERFLFTESMWGCCFCTGASDPRGHRRGRPRRRRSRGPDRRAGRAGGGRTEGTGRGRWDLSPSSAPGSPAMIHPAYPFGSKAAHCTGWQRHRVAHVSTRAHAIVATAGLYCASRRQCDTPCIGVRKDAS